MVSRGVWQAEGSLTMRWLYFAKSALLAVAAVLLEWPSHQPTFQKIVVLAVMAGMSVLNFVIFVVMSRRD